MRKITKAKDISGRVLSRGDTVGTLSGDLTARIADIAVDTETEFVRLRPVHQPNSPGIWHAADRVMWLATARKRKRPTGPVVKPH